MTYPPYAEYRTTGATWMARLPSHWTIVSFRRCCTIQEGQVDPRGDEHADTFLIAPNHIEAHTGRLLELETAATQSAISGKYQCNTGDVIYSKIRPSLSKVCIAPSDCLCSADMYPIRARDGMCNEFIRWWLLSAPVVDQIVLASQRVAMPKVNRDSLNEMPVIVPPIQEQRAIARFLDRETAKIDSLVAEKERLMALLREKRQAVLSHAVTKGLNPDATMLPSGVEWLGDLPSHWRVERIANLFSEVAEEGLDGLPILSVSIHTGVSDDELDESELERKITRSDDRSKYKRVAPDDLVYNMMRAWQGGFGTVGVAGMVSPAYVVARPRVRLRTDYIENVLRTPNAVEQMRRHSRGVTDFRLRLYWEEFRNIRVPVPPRDEMDAICERIGQISAQFAAMTDACMEAIHVLNQRRAALISAAVTGQIDVRHHAPADAA